MANKERYSVSQVIAALDATKGMKARAAKMLGCHHSTVTNYAQRHPTVAAALSQNREEMTDAAELSLYQAVLDGEAWAVCFYLKTQGKDRGYVERAEVGGVGGGPIQHEVKATREERFDKLYAALDTAGRTGANENGSGGDRSESLDTNGS